MGMGFERIVWIDADAVVSDFSVDLSSLIDRGIGMVHHFNPTHWNSGVMVVVNSIDTRRFFEAVNAEPENDSAWMEQLAVNQLASRAEYGQLFTALDPTYNSTPGAVVAASPAVWAAHGLPFEQRRQLIAKWVNESQAKLLSSTERAGCLPLQVQSG